VAADWYLTDQSQQSFQNQLTTNLVLPKHIVTYFRTIYLTYTQQLLWKYFYKIQSI